MRIKKYRTDQRSQTSEIQRIHVCLLSNASAVRGTSSTHTTSHGVLVSILIQNKIVWRRYLRGQRSKQPPRARLCPIISTRTSCTSYTRTRQRRVCSENSAAIFPDSDDHTHTNTRAPVVVAVLFAEHYLFRVYSRAGRIAGHRIASAATRVPDMCVFLLFCAQMRDCCTAGTRRRRPSHARARVRKGKSKVISTCACRSDGDAENCVH